MNEFMERRIGVLTEARAMLAEQEALVATCKADLEQTPEFIRLQATTAQLKDVKEWEAESADAVREMALSLFTSTGEKKPHKNVQVKMFTKLVYDAGQALEYALANLPAALKLDTKKFEAVAKALSLPFIATEEEPRVYIDAVLEVTE